MIIIGDTHGNLKTLKALLDKIPQEEKDKGVIFTGDLIDRGPNSRGVIDLVRNNNYYCVKGNHEYMMVDEHQNVLNMIKQERCWWTAGLWILNGGKETIDSYRKEDRTFDIDAIKDHIEWANKLPFFKKFIHIRGEEDRFLVVSHSHIANIWKKLERPTQEANQRLKDMIWGRPHVIDCVPEIYNVIGHTPIKNGPRITKVYANIDTGCYYNKEPGYFKLTALQYPEMIIYQQENIDK